MPRVNPAELAALQELLNLGGLSGLVGGAGGAGKLGRLGQSLAGSDVVKAILIWQVLGQVLGPLMQPLTTELQQAAYKQFPGRVLAPADLADMVVRAVLDLDRAQSEAEYSGIDNERFGFMVRNTGEPIPPADALLAARRGIIPVSGAGGDVVSLEQAIRESRLKNKYIPVVEALQWQVLSAAEAVDTALKGATTEADAIARARLAGVQEDEFRLLLAIAGEPLPPMEALAAFRRGLIPKDGSGPDVVSLEQAIRESRLKNKYTATLEAMQWQPLTAAEAVAAWLRGQIPEADALARAAVAGTAEPEARILYNLSGRPPSVGELATLLHRGLIPLEGTGPDVKSFQQGIAEGDTKDKWWREFAALAVHLPPPRSIVAMVRSGSMSDTLALQLLEQNGLSPELAAIYLADAHHAKTQTARELTTAQVLNAYQLKIVDAATATAMLSKLGWTAENAAVLLAEKDSAHARAQVEAAITRTRSLFISHKASTEEVTKALKAYGLPEAAITEYLNTWTLERRQNVKLLSQAEIAWAFANDMLDQAGALAELAAQGYSPRDAWIVLSHHSKVTLKGEIPPQVSPGDELTPAR